MKRWVRREERRLFGKQQCKFCASFFPCGRSTCLRCNSVVCSSHGLARGQCPICYHGLLTGWSGNDRLCGYKGCGQPGVARGRGRKPVCAYHADHQGLPKGDWSRWEEVEDEA